MRKALVFLHNAQFFLIIFQVDSKKQDKVSDIESLKKNRAKDNTLLNFHLFNNIYVLVLIFTALI